MKIHRLTSSLHLHKTFESDIEIIDLYHTTVPIPENFQKPKFVNGGWIDETQEQFLDSVSKSAYSVFRAAEYPSIQEQMDMQYWDSVNGTTTWQDAINKVKAKYPKSE